MRVSDAERQEVADQLSRHYADGRLDQAEFDRRLEQAMNAKTRADLDGLLTDLPGGEPPEPPAAGQRHDGRRRRHQRSVVILLATIAIVVFISNALHGLWIPWLLIALVAFLLLRRADARRRHY
jgi:Flp pilus assembly protein TadB